MRCKAQTLQNRQCKHPAVLNGLCIIHLNKANPKAQKIRNDIFILKKRKRGIKYRIDGFETKLLTANSGWTKFKLKYQIAGAVKAYADTVVRMSLLKNELKEMYIHNNKRR